VHGSRIGTTIAMFFGDTRPLQMAGVGMNRTAGDQVEDKGRPIAPLLIIGVAIGLIYLPMACGLSAKIDLAAAVTRPL
jgi:hypothetical protein